MDPGTIIELPMCLRGTGPGMGVNRLKTDNTNER